MLPRFHVGQGLNLCEGQEVMLPEGATRHVQVLRMQPGDALHLFDGGGNEWRAHVLEMGRRHVSVTLRQAVAAPAAELHVRVTLAVGMPANDRMDALVEKATELGATAIQPLVCERSVLRLEGDRASKKVAHWQAVAASASEQCGRAVVPLVHPITALTNWLSTQESGRAAQGSRANEGCARGVLSLREAVSMRAWLAAQSMWMPIGVAEGAARAPGADAARRPAFVTFLSGPEGGLSEQEEQAALAAGWQAVSLGRRILRADTAPLAAMAAIGCAYEG